MAQGISKSQLQLQSSLAASSQKQQQPVLNCLSPPKPSPSSNMTSQPFSLHPVRLWVSISVGVLSSVLAVLLAPSLICKKMLLVDTSKGREDVLWCTEGHIIKPKSSKYRLFGKCLYFWTSYCLNLRNCFVLGTRSTCCFQH